MNDFINHLKQLTPAIATIVGSILSAIIALTVVFITRHFENKKENKEKYDTYKKYANPIIFACEQLAWRLKEILEFNGAYLLPDAPSNGFFKYKFDSTVYRLCVILGWIQAAQKEQSYIEGLKVKHHKNIQAAIIDFQMKLADGSHVEVSILDDLIKLFGLNAALISANERAMVGVELEKIIFKHIPDSVKRNASLLPINQQVQMVKEILDHICNVTNQTKVNQHIVEERITTATKEISREFCWIYRDWQSAIGDEMLKELKDANRRFDIIGFGEFQTIHDNNEWLKKADGLFTSLDVAVDDRFDSRVQQLKQLFGTIIEIINVLQQLISRHETIPIKRFEKLKNFNLQINQRTLIKKKKKLRLIYE